MKESHLQGAHTHTVGAHSHSLGGAHTHTVALRWRDDAPTK